MPFPARQFEFNPNARLPSRAEIQAEMARREHSKLFAKEQLSVEGTRKACRKLATFVKMAWPILHPVAPYIHGWHIDLICDHLEAITYGKFKAHGFDNRLKINEPPGTMKSLLVNVFWSAWEWGPAGMPWMMNIGTSYKGENCKRDLGKCHDLIISEWFQRHWPLKLVKAGAEYMQNERRGDYRGIPFGSLTQYRADRVKIDDPHSTETAESDLDRARATLRFRESVPTRLNDPISSAIVLIMQRLHADDLSGVEEKLQLGYMHINLPMEFETGKRCITPFGKDRRTFEGELLFPERFPKSVVERDKIALGPYATAGQFQQRPSPRSGGMFKRTDFKFVDALPVGTKQRKVRNWDLAATIAAPGTDPDWTAGVRMSVYNGNYYIEDVTRFRAGPNKVRQAIRETGKADGGSCHILVPQDPGQAGKDQVATIISENAGKRIYAHRESKDKAMRAEPLAAQVEAGNVYILVAPWNEEFIHEMCSFPTGHDDQVDAASGAFNHLTNKKRFPVIAQDILDRVKQPGTKMQARNNPIAQFKPRIVLGRMNHFR